MELNNALDVFTAEMKAVDLWDNVTLIETSDFARTLNPNGGDGTDHAWGGNYFMMGKSFFVMSSQQENSFLDVYTKQHFSSTHDVATKGGSVKGKQVLGQYPEDITDAGPLTLGRGAF